MAEQIIEVHEPEEAEVTAAWMAHNGAIVDAGASGVTGINAMRVALRAAAAHRREAHAEHEEFTDGCEDCLVTNLRFAYEAVKTEYREYREDHRATLARLGDASGSITPQTYQTVHAQIMAERSRTTRDAKAPANG